MAAVAEHLAWRERQEADAAQRTLSEVKLWRALWPDGAKLELIAPKLKLDAPADVLGVRPRLSRPAPRSRGTRMPRPHPLRPSKLRNAAFRPGDDAEIYCGGWSRERLLAMDQRFAAAMARAAPVPKPCLPASPAEAPVEGPAAPQGSPLRVSSRRPGR